MLELPELRKQYHDALQYAEEGHCLERWYQAADVAERYCKLTEHTDFQTSLTRGMFMSRFERWKRRKGKKACEAARIRDNPIAEARAAESNHAFQS